MTCYFLYLICVSLTIDGVEPVNYKNVEEGKPIDIKRGKETIKIGDKITSSKVEEIDLESLPKNKANDERTLRINPIKKKTSGLFTCSKTKKGENLPYSVNIYLNEELSKTVFK